MKIAIYQGFGTKVVEDTRTFTILLKRLKMTNYSRSDELSSGSVDSPACAFALHMARMRAQVTISVATLVQSHMHLKDFGECFHICSVIGSCDIISY